MPILRCAHPDLASTTVHRLPLQRKDLTLPPPGEIGEPRDVRDRLGTSEQPLPRIRRARTVVETSHIALADIEERQVSAARVRLGHRKLDPSSRREDFDRDRAPRRPFGGRNAGDHASPGIESTSRNTRSHDGRGAKRHRPRNRTRTRSSIRITARGPTAPACPRGRARRPRRRAAVSSQGASRESLAPARSDHAMTDDAVPSSPDCSAMCRTSRKRSPRIPRAYAHARKISLRPPTPHTDRAV